MDENILSAALAFEKEGVALYLGLEKKAAGDLAKRLFQSLEKQEKDHISYITSYTKSKKFKPMEYIPLEDALKKIYAKIKPDEQKKTVTDLEGYELSLKLESKGYALYKGAFNRAENAEDKQFFEFLMRMEQEHYEALANVYYYLTNNAQWLSENESRTWSWMDL